LEELSDTSFGSFRLTVSSTPAGLRKVNGCSKSGMPTRVDDADGSGTGDMDADDAGVGEPEGPAVAITGALAGGSLFGNMLKTWTSTTKRARAATRAAKGNTAVRETRESRRGSVKVGTQARRWRVVATVVIVVRSKPSGARVGSGSMKADSRLRTFRSSVMPALLPERRRDRLLRAWLAAI
jgi:hypothetical protein